MKNSGKKIEQFEWLRAFAAIAVIVIHTVNSALIMFGHTASELELLLYQCMKNLVWWGVPCFLMITGSLLLNENRVISLDKLFKKYILRMIYVLFLFGTVFSWIEIVFDSGKVSLLQIPTAFLYVVQGKTWAHMWYIYCLIGLYLLLPVFKIIVERLEKKEFLYVLLVLFLFGFVARIGEPMGFELGIDIPIEAVYSFWLLMGGAWNKAYFKCNVKKALILFITSSFILIATTIVEYYLKISLSCFYGYAGIIVAIQALSIFMLVNSLEDICIKKYLEEIADKSFGIYLVHMFFINILYKVFKINPFDTSLLVGVVLVLVILCLSYIATCVMKRMPIIKKII